MQHGAVCCDSRVSGEQRTNTPGQSPMLAAKVLSSRPGCEYVLARVQEQEPSFVPCVGASGRANSDFEGGVECDGHEGVLGYICDDADA